MLRIVNILLVVFATGVSAVYWLELSFADRASAAFTLSSPASRNGALINGAEIDLSSSASVEVIRRSRPAADGKTLLLALSDTCPAVAKLLPHWQRMLGALTPEGDVNVAILSLGGEQRAMALANDLEAHQISYAIYRVVKPVLLAAETGINSTPYTIALDRERRIRRVSIGTEVQAFPEVLATLMRCLSSAC